MELGLAGKVAIITGSSRGIGRSIALTLADEGANVVLTARGADQLELTKAEVEAKGAQVLAVQADIKSPEDMERIVASAADRFGRIDILVNNAGGSFPGDEDEAWNGAFEANILAAARATRLVVPHMRANGGGSVIHIASIWGREGGGAVTYNAMKAAMISHAKQMALSLAKDNIRVNSVAPGSIRHPGGSWDRRAIADPEDMDRFVKDNIAMGRFGRADEVADLVTYLASERASWITGACINVDGGQTRSNI